MFYDHFKKKNNLILSEYNSGTGWSEVANSCFARGNGFKNYILSMDGLYLITNNGIDNKFDFEIKLVSKFIRFSKFSFDRRKIFSIFTMIPLLIAIFKIRPSSLIISPETLAFSSFFLNKIFNIPSCYLLHGSYSNLFRENKIKTLHPKDKFVAVSKFTLKDSEIDTSKCNCSIINPGINKKKWFEDKSKFKLKLISFLEDKKFITYVAKGLKERKGFKYVYETLNYIEKLDFFNEKLYIVLPGELSRDNINRIKKINSNLNKCEIIHTGFLSQSDMRRLFSKSNLNILPSKSTKKFYEGYGLVHLEAGACGSPTVGCYNSGNEDSCNFSGSFLINFGDTKKLAEIIISSYKDGLEKPDPNSIKTTAQFNQEINDCFFKDIY